MKTLSQAVTVTVKRHSYCRMKKKDAIYTLIVLDQHMFELKNVYLLISVLLLSCPNTDAISLHLWMYGKIALIIYWLSMERP